MHGRLFCVWLILAAATSIGCGSGKSNESISSSGSSGSGAAQLTAGQLVVSPTVLDFGQIPVGTTKVQSGVLTAGPARVTVRSAGWSGEGYAISGIVFPLTIPAGQSAHFTVTFAPQAAGNVSGSVKFVSDATHDPQVTFSGGGTQTGSHTVTLAWNAPKASVVGFNVYRGAAAQGPFTKITSAPKPEFTFTDASVIDGETYFYATTSVNKNGKESKYSNQVQVTIPNS